MTHGRHAFAARNAALLGAVVAIGLLLSADVAQPLPARVPLVVALLFVAAALVIWNRIAPAREGGVAHARINTRDARGRRRRGRSSPG